MIVVVGNPSWGGALAPRPTGLVAGIARAAAEGGARVEVVGRIGDDDEGDALLLALAAARVGHVAVLRDPARATLINAPETPAEAPLEDVELDPLASDDAVSAGGEGTTRGEAPSPVLEAADVSLGLRYLTEFEVLVLADDVPPDALPVAVDAAAYAGAHLVVVVPPDARPPRGLPPDTTVLEAPERDLGNTFATLVGRYAAGLDAGIDPRQAFRSAAETSGWEGVRP